MYSYEFAFVYVNANGVRGIVDVKRGDAKIDQLADMAEKALLWASHKQGRLVTCWFHPGQQRRVVTKLFVAELKAR